MNVCIPVGLEWRWCNWACTSSEGTTCASTCHMHVLACHMHATSGLFTHACPRMSCACCMYVLACHLRIMPHMHFLACHGHSHVMVMFMSHACPHMLHMRFTHSTLSPYPCSAVIGEIDEEMEAEINLSEIRAEPLNPVMH